jgi:hypothetical protein
MRLVRFSLVSLVLLAADGALADPGPVKPVSGTGAQLIPGTLKSIGAISSTTLEQDQPLLLSLAGEGNPCSFEIKIQPLADDPKDPYLTTKSPGTLTFGTAKGFPFTVSAKLGASMLIPRAYHVWAEPHSAWPNKCKGTRTNTLLLTVKPKGPPKPASAIAGAIPPSGAIGGAPDVTVQQVPGKVTKVTMASPWYSKTNQTFEVVLHGERGRKCSAIVDVTHAETGVTASASADGIEFPSTMTVNGHWPGDMPAGNYKATVRPGNDPQTRCAVASPVVAFFELAPKDAKPGMGWVTLDSGDLTISPVTSSGKSPIVATYKSKPSLPNSGSPMCGATAVLREMGTDKEVHTMVFVHTNVADTQNMFDLWKKKYATLSPGEYGLTISSTPENASIVTGGGKTAEACLGKMGNVFHVTGSGATSIVGFRMSSELQSGYGWDEDHTNIHLRPILDGKTACRYTGRVRVNPGPNPSKDISEHFDFVPGKQPDEWVFRIPYGGGDPGLVEFWSTTDDGKDGHTKCAGSFSKTVKLYGTGTFQ